MSHHRDADDDNTTQDDEHEFDGGIGEGTRESGQGMGSLRRRE
jgi:hypothetical protein